MDKKDLPKLSVVLSGVPGYFKLRSKHDDLFKITAQSLRQCLDYIEELLPGNVELHGLYNAFTEETMARRASSKTIDEPFTKIFPRGMHADSGGLQMVTLGKGEISKKDRELIYKTQAQYSHYAMSFDEIPSIMKDDIRYYLPHTVKEKGVESGFNLKEQYDYFAGLETDCKIIPIAHGWGIDDTNDFAEGLFAQLSKQELRDLDIIATGFPTSSTHASAKRIFDLYRAEKIPVNAKKHLHLLGMTGFKRLIPILQMIKNGFTPNLEHLTFDSVTLTMSYVMGGTVNSVKDFQNNKPKRKLGKKRTDNTDNYWQEIYDFWSGDPHFPFDDLDDMLEHSYYNSKKLTSGFQQYEYYLNADDEGNFTKANKKLADFHFSKVLKQEQYYILYQVYNYVQILEAFLEDKITLEQIFKGTDLTIFQALENVTTESDFNDWFDHVKKVTGFKVNTLGADDEYAEETTSLFFDVKEEKKERKKQPPRIAKQSKAEDDTTTMDLLF